jgi:hypothetical protein
VCSLFADAEDVFSGGVEADDQQGPIEENDARTQAVENFQGVPVKDAAAGTLCPAIAAFFYRLMTFCCT